MQDSYLLRLEGDKAVYSLFLANKVGGLKAPLRPPHLPLESPPHQYTPPHTPTQSQLKLRKRKRRGDDPVPERVTITHRGMT